MKKASSSKDVKQVLELHEHIQTAMGWTNLHLHQFEIDGQRYGDRELPGDGLPSIMPAPLTSIARRTMC